jgi:hypothetical protein
MHDLHTDVREMLKKVQTRNLFSRGSAQGWPSREGHRKGHRRKAGGRRPCRLDKALSGRSTSVAGV